MIKFNTPIELRHDIIVYILPPKFKCKKRASQEPDPHKSNPIKTTSCINNQTKSFTTLTSHYFKMNQIKISSISIPSSWKKFPLNLENSGSNKRISFTNLFLAAGKFS
jgi:hypothetical protein